MAAARESDGVVADATSTQQATSPSGCHEHREQRERRARGASGPGLRRSRARGGKGRGSRRGSGEGQRHRGAARAEVAQPGGQPAGSRVRLAQHRRPTLGDARNLSPRARYWGHQASASEVGAAASSNMLLITSSSWFGIDKPTSLAAALGSSVATASGAGSSVATGSVATGSGAGSSVATGGGGFFGGDGGGSVATGSGAGSSVATGSVATGSGAGSSVATGSVATGSGAGSSVATGSVATGSGAGSSVATGSVATGSGGGFFGGDWFGGDWFGGDWFGGDGFGCGGRHDLVGGHGRPLFSAGAVGAQRDVRAEDGRRDEHRPQQPAAHVWELLPSHRLETTLRAPSVESPAIERDSLRNESTGCWRYFAQSDFGC